MSSLTTIKESYKRTIPLPSGTFINNDVLKKEIPSEDLGFGYGKLAEQAQILTRITFFKDIDHRVIDISLSPNEYQLFIEKVFPIIGDKKLSSIFNEILIACDSKLIFIEIFLSSKSLKHLIFQCGASSIQSLLNLENQDFFKNFESITSDLDFFLNISLPDPTFSEEFKKCTSQILKKNSINYQEYNNKWILNNQIQLRFFFDIFFLKNQFSFCLNQIISSQEISTNKNNKNDESNDIEESEGTNFFISWSLEISSNKESNDKDEDSDTEEDNEGTSCFISNNLMKEISNKAPFNPTNILENISKKDFLHFLLGILPSFDFQEEKSCFYLIEQITNGEIYENFTNLKINSSINISKIKEWLINQKDPLFVAAYFLNFIFFAPNELENQILLLGKEILVQSDIPYLNTLYKWIHASLPLSVLRVFIEIGALKSLLSKENANSISCFYLKGKGHLIQWAWNTNIVVQIPFDIHETFKILSQFNQNDILENRLIFELESLFFSLAKIESLRIERLNHFQMTPAIIYDYIQKFLNSEAVSLHFLALHLLPCCKIDVSTKRALFLIFSPDLVLNLPEGTKNEFLSHLKGFTGDSNIEKGDLISSHKVLRSLAFNNKYCLLNEVLTTILNYKIWKFDEITFNYFVQYCDLLFLYPNQDLPKPLLHTISKYIVSFPNEFFAKQPFSQAIKNTFHFLIMHLRDSEKKMAMKLLLFSEKIFHDSAPKKEWVANLFFEFITPYLNSSSFDAWSLLKKLSCEPLISYLAPIQKKQIEGYFSSTADLKKIQEFTILLNKGAFFDAKLKITNFLIHHPQFPSNQAAALLFDLLCQKNLKEKKYDREIALLWITWGIKDLEYFQQDDQKKVFVKMFVELSSSILTQNRDIDEILNNIFQTHFSIDPDSMEFTQFAYLLANFNLSIPSNENASQYFKIVLEKLCKDDWNLTKSLYKYCEKWSLIKFFHTEFVVTLITLANEQSDTQALAKFLDHPQLSDSCRRLIAHEFLKNKGFDPIIFALWLGYMDFFEIHPEDQDIFQKIIINLPLLITTNLHYKIGFFFNKFIKKQIEINDPIKFLERIILLNLNFVNHSETLDFLIRQLYLCTDSNWKEFYQIYQKIISKNWNISWIEKENSLLLYYLPLAFKERDIYIIFQICSTIAKNFPEDFNKIDLETYYETCKKDNELILTALFIKCLFYNKKQISISLINEMLDYLEKIFIQNEDWILNVVFFLVHKIPKLDASIFIQHPDLFLKFSNILCKLINPCLKNNEVKHIEIIVDLYTQYYNCFLEDQWLMLINTLEKNKKIDVLMNILEFSEEQDIFDDFYQARIDLWEKISLFPLNQKQKEDFFNIFKKTNINFDNNINIDSLKNKLRFTKVIFEIFVKNSYLIGSIRNPSILHEKFIYIFNKYRALIKFGKSDEFIDNSEIFFISQKLPEPIRKILDPNEIMQKSTYFVFKNDWLMEEIDGMFIDLILAFIKIDLKKSVDLFSFFIKGPHSKSTWIKAKIFFPYLINEKFKQYHLYFLLTIINFFEDKSIPLKDIIENRKTYNEVYLILIGNIIYKFWKKKSEYPFSHAYPQKILDDIVKINVLNPNSELLDVCNNLVEIILSQINTFKAISILEYLLYLAQFNEHKLVAVALHEQLLKSIFIAGLQTGPSLTLLVKHSANLVLFLSNFDTAFPSSFIIQMYRIQKLSLDYKVLGFIFFDHYLEELRLALLPSNTHFQPMLYLLFYFAFIKDKKLNYFEITTEHHIFKKIFTSDKIIKNIDSSLLNEIDNQTFDTFNKLELADASIDKFELNGDQKIAQEMMNHFFEIKLQTDIVFSFHCEIFSDSELKYFDFYFSFLLLRLAKVAFSKEIAMSQDPSPIVLKELVDRLITNFHCFSQRKKEYYMHLLAEITHLAINKGNLINISKTLLCSIFCMIENNFFKTNPLLILRIVYKLALCPTLFSETFFAILDQIKVTKEEEEYKSAIAIKYLVYNIKELDESKIDDKEKKIFQYFDNQDYFW